MKKTEPLPQAQDWDHFWAANRATDKSHVSWSKRRIIEVLRSHIRPGQMALDAGCGSGFFSKYFCDSGLRTTSVDYAPQALALTEKMTAGRSNVARLDLTGPDALIDLRQKFDVIFTDGLFEHFSRVDQNKIMQNFLQVLAVHGIIFTFVPNQWSPWEIIRPFFMPGIVEKPFVLRELIELNEQNGLVVIEKGGVNTLPWRFSPDRMFGSTFGMLLYAVARKYE